MKSISVVALLVCCLAFTARSQQFVKVKRSLLDQYTGKYLFETDTVKCFRAADSLYLISRGQTVQLFANDSATFYAKGEPGIIVFTKNEKGKVTGITAHVDANTPFFPRIE